MPLCMLPQCFSVGCAAAVDCRSASKQPSARCLPQALEVASLSKVNPRSTKVIVMDNQVRCWGCCAGALLLCGVAAVRPPHACARATAAAAQLHPWQPRG